MRKYIFALMVFILSGLIFHPMKLQAAADLPKDSLYLLQGNWKNQEAAPTELKSFAGVPVIMAMTYTGCQFSCPLTLNKLADIEKDLKARKIEKYQIVIASFDAEKDKPEVLKAYMIKRKLDPAHWTFLSAKSDQDVRELAVLLNINYQKIDGGDFSHSNGISLMDSQGRMLLQLKGLASDHKELVDKVASYEKQN